MAEFNSVEDFYSSLIQELGIALREALEEAKQIAYDYIITNWYQKYPVHEYERLNLMIDSLQSKYEIQGDSLVATLYIKNDELHPVSNSWNKNEVTYEYLYEWFSENYRETPILEHTQEVLDDMKILVNIIRDTLKSKGYDFE
jgi:hypothetical protein